MNETEKPSPSPADADGESPTVGKAAAKKAADRAAAKEFKDRQRILKKRYPTGSWEGGRWWVCLSPHGRDERIGNLRILGVALPRPSTFEVLQRVLETGGRVRWNDRKKVMAGSVEAVRQTSAGWVAIDDDGEEHDQNSEFYLSGWADVLEDLIDPAWVPTNLDV